VAEVGSGIGQKNSGEARRSALQREGGAAAPRLGRRRGGEKQRGGGHCSNFDGGEKGASTARPCPGEKERGVPAGQSGARRGGARGNGLVGDIDPDAPELGGGRVARKSCGQREQGGLVGSCCRAGQPGKESGPDC
jgi:hypothetical protein